MQMLRTELAGHQLPICIYNASGPRCTTEEELIALAISEFTGLVLSKSCTLESREGNPLPRYYNTDQLTINSTGLANLGYQFYEQVAPRLKVPEINPVGKPYFVSVSGMSLEDNLTIIRHLRTQSAVDGIELNLSCPNIVGKPQIGYDLESSAELLRRVSELELPVHHQPLGLKLPPYFDPIHIEQMSDLFKDFTPQIRFLTCINSLGNGLVLNPETEQVTIKPKNGLGGIGGSVVKPFALSNVYQFRQLMPSSVDLVGCGGVQSGTDVAEHLLVGASAVQIGSTFMEQGGECFERISQELIIWMEQKGYTSLEDFRGQVKTLN